VSVSRKIFSIAVLTPVSGKLPKYSIELCTAANDKKAHKSTFNNFGLNERVHWSVS
jgi:hypothetical protein